MSKKDQSRPAGKLEKDSLIFESKSKETIPSSLMIPASVIEWEMLTKLKTA